MMTLRTGLKQQYSASDDTIDPNKEEKQIWGFLEGGTPKLAPK